MGSRKTNIAEINGEILGKELKKRKIPFSVASINIGFDESYISKAIRSNRISKSAVKLIQMIYGIDADIYIVKEELAVKDEQQVVEIVQSVGMTDEVKKDLYKIIYSATYEAMKRALND